MLRPPATSTTPSQSAKTITSQSVRTILLNDMATSSYHVFQYGHEHSASGGCRQIAQQAGARWFRGTGLPSRQLWWHHTISWSGRFTEIPAALVVRLRRAPIQNAA